VLRVASWNIHKGVGSDRRRDLGRTAAVIAEIAPDILALQEADTRFGTRRGLLDLPALARATGLVPVPVPGAGPAHGWHGNLILVRGAVGAVETIDLPGLEPRGALIAEVTIGGRRLRVVGTHLGLLAASRAAQARALVDRLDRLEPMEELLMGDLNEWGGNGAGSLRTLRQRFRLPPPVPSFPARYPLLPLDRIMASPSAALSDLAVHRSALARRASDHLPLTARLCPGGLGPGG
jgi:endonuclease/exonuclease/phosphatase family metal-dependent hydrolase